MAEDSLDTPADQSTSAGPSEPRHLMYRTYPSTAAIWSLVGYCAVVAAAIGILGLDSFSRITDPCYASGDCDGAGRSEQRPEPAANGETPTPTATPSASATPAAAESPTPAPPGSPPPTPTATPSASATPRGDEVPPGTGGGRYAGERSPDADLLILVALTGALGGLVHVLTSLGHYVGERRFLRSWIVFYYLRPPAGAGLAIGTYFVLRMATPAVGVKDLNLFSILAFAMLSGLFARQAIDKLAQVFDTMFLKVEKKVESKPIDELIYHADADKPLDRESAESQAEFAPEEDVAGTPKAAEGAAGKAKPKRGTDGPATPGEK